MSSQWWWHNPVPDPLSEWSGGYLTVRWLCDDGFAVKIQCRRDIRRFKVFVYKEWRWPGEDLRHYWVVDTWTSRVFYLGRVGTWLAGVLDAIVNDLQDPSFQQGLLNSRPHLRCVNR